MSSNELPGINYDNVTKWFIDHVPEVAPPLSFDKIAGGHSNLTFDVRDQGGGRWVLRRPPLGQVLATAHDMSREHRIISALAPTDVPVAPVVGFCDDESVNDAPFYVMGFVDGIVARDAETAETQLTLDQRAQASRSLAATLAKIHAVDIDAVGLSDLGRHDGYIERQLKRWQGQFEKSGTRDLPDMHRAHDRLAARVPAQIGTAIVHGDYRLDNCMLDADGNVNAVLDWEICTLGDPMADVGLLMVYWSEADDQFSALPTAPTTVEGFMTRDQVLDEYVAASGRDVDNIDYYVAFAYWKLGCIIEGVYARYVGGAMGDVPPEAELFGEAVKTYGQLANERLDA